jgi:polar amino acid transport system substrate-binding protein
MGTNAEFPPYEFYEADKVVGIDAEIAQAIADKLEMTLVIEDMAFDSIITAVDTGKSTWAWQVDSYGRASSERQLFHKLRHRSSSRYRQRIRPISNVDDLFGTTTNTIGVQTSTTGDLYATWDIEDAGLGTIQRYNKGADAVAALASEKSTVLS